MSKEYKYVLLGQEAANAYLADAGISEVRQFSYDVFRYEVNVTTAEDIMNTVIKWDGWCFLEDESAYLRLSNQSLYYDDDDGETFLWKEINQFQANQICRNEIMTTHYLLGDGGFAEVDCVADTEVSDRQFFIEVGYV
jgi:hypothetical protein